MDGGAQRQRSIALSRKIVPRIWHVTCIVDSGYCIVDTLLQHRPLGLLADYLVDDIFSAMLILITRKLCSVQRWAFLSFASNKHAKN